MNNPWPFSGYASLLRPLLFGNPVKHLERAHRNFSPAVRRSWRGASTGEPSIQMRATDLAPEKKSLPL